MGSGARVRCGIALPALPSVMHRLVSSNLKPRNDESHQVSQAAFGSLEFPFLLTACVADLQGLHDGIQGAIEGGRLELDSFWRALSAIAHA